LFLAALQAIPDSYMEVCDIEGASKWERFWTVTFPVVAPTTFIVFVYTVIASFTDVRNVVMSNILGLFNNMHLGTAVASAVFYFLLIVLLLGIIYQLTKKKVFID
jgi:ABC-type sugar transport system permease subunit